MLKLNELKPLLLMVTLLDCSCTYNLCGNNVIPELAKNIVVYSNNQYYQLINVIYTQLRLYGILFNKHHTENNVIYIFIDKEIIDDSIIPISLNKDIYEHQITLNIKVHLKFNNIIHPINLIVSRYLLDDSTQILVHDSKRNLLLNMLRIEMVDQLIRKLIIFSTQFKRS